MSLFNRYGIVGILCAVTGPCWGVTDVSLTGTYDVWEEGAGDNGVLTNIGQVAGPFEGYLGGGSSNPDDNIEMGNVRTFGEWSFGSNKTIMTGTLGSITFTLTTPSQIDWTANNAALARAYAGAALKSINKSPDDWDDLGTGITYEDAVVGFVIGDGGGESGAHIISDPNVAYIKEPVGGGDGVRVGLQGFYDATSTIGPLLPFVGYDDNVDPAPPQVSEVVHAQIEDGGTPVFSGYLFRFFATYSGQGADDCYAGGNPPPGFDCSFSANYDAVLSQACTDGYVTVNGPLTYDAFTRIEADPSIETNGSVIVASTGDVEYAAEYSMGFGPGFGVEVGGLFLASIEPVDCPAP